MYYVLVLYCLLLKQPIQHRRGTVVGRVITRTSRPQFDLTLEIENKRHYLKFGTVQVLSINIIIMHFQEKEYQVLVLF